MSPRANSNEYFVYILASDSGVLYTGVTNDLARRIAEHRQDHNGGFTTRYKIRRLVYFEATPDVRSTLERENQIKSWRRSKKLALIRSVNPRFEDLLPVS